MLAAVAVQPEIPVVADEEAGVVHLYKFPLPSVSEEVVGNVNCIVDFILTFIINILMVIKTLDPQKCLEIVNQHENILDKPQKDIEKYFSMLVCIKCGSNSIDRFPFLAVEEGVQKVVYDGLLPKQMAKCKSCQCEFEPYTKLITKEK